MTKIKKIDRVIDPEMWWREAKKHFRQDWPEGGGILFGLVHGLIETWNHFCIDIFMKEHTGLGPMILLISYQINPRIDIDYFIRQPDSF